LLETRLEGLPGAEGVSYLALKNAALLAEKYRGYKQAGKDSRTVPRMGSRSSAHRQTTGNGHVAGEGGPQHHRNHVGIATTY